MNFDDHQKEIIKAIYDEKIYDILSFVKEFGYYTIYKNDKQEIINKFNEHGKKYKVLKPGKSNIVGGYNFLSGESPKLDFSDDLYEEKAPVIGYNKAVSTIQYNEHNYTYSLCSDEGIYISTSFSEIKNFIAIWEYLKRELEVLEVKKEINPSELGLFFNIVQKGCTRNELNLKAATQKSIENQPKINSDELPKPATLTSSSIVNITPNVGVLSGSTPTVDASVFIDTELDCDYDKLNICEYYFDKKILPTPALKNFIDEDFSTPEQISNRKSLNVAWIAIRISIIATIISIGMGAFSIYATYNVDPSDYNLKQIQSHLTSLESKINSSTENQLNNILYDLQEMDISEYDDSELQAKLDSLIKLIQEAVDK